MSYRRLMLTQYLGFITIGFAASITGPLVLAIRADLRLNYSQAGLVLSGLFIGVLITVLLGGTWADRFGKKRYLLAGGVFMCAGLFGCMLAASYPWLLGLTIITGIGFGTYEIGMNALCADISGANKGAAMNLLHLFFGIGAVIAPVLATISLKLTGSWRPAFGIIAIFPVIVSFLIYSLDLPGPVRNVEIKKGHPYRNWFIWLCGLTVFIYIGIESTFFGWLPAYWTSLSSAASIPASLTTGIFWLALTLGRLVSSRIADRIGISRFIIIITGLGLVLAIIWWFLPDGVFATVSVVFLIGIIIAGIFPTVMASATSRYPDRTAEISGFITFFPAAGGFLLPAGFGRVADKMGVSIIPLILMILSALIFISAILTWGWAEKRLKAAG